MAQKAKAKELTDESNFAVIKTGGKQYCVTTGDYLDIEKLETEEGKEVSFDEVLLSVEGGEVSVGAPTVSGKSVKAKVLEHGKEDKVIVIKYKAKSRYFKKNGHRQPYTRVEIVKI